MSSCFSLLLTLFRSCCMFFVNLLVLLLGNALLTYWLIWLFNRYCFICSRHLLFSWWFHDFFSSFYPDIISMTSFGLVRYVGHCTGCSMSDSNQNCNSKMSGHTADPAGWLVWLADWVEWETLAIQSFLNFPVCLSQKVIHGVGLGIWATVGQPCFDAFAFIRPPVMGLGTKIGWLLGAAWALGGNILPCCHFWLISLRKRS